MNCFTPNPFFFVIFLLCFGGSAAGFAGSRSSGVFGAIRLPTDVVDDGEGSSSMCALVAKPASCPVSCFKTEPVCGADGVTYWCGCADAICAGTRVVKLGFCEDGDSGSGSSLPGQAPPPPPLRALFRFDWRPKRSTFPVIWVSEAPAIAADC